MDTVNKNTVSFGLSLTITAILSAILVVIKELNENSVLAAMKAMTGHHWITHGVLAVIAFFVIGWGLSKANNGEGLKITPERLAGFIVGGVVISGLIIAGFYLIGD